MNELYIGENIKYLLYPNWLKFLSVVIAGSALGIIFTAVVIYGNTTSSHLLVFFVISVSQIVLLAEVLFSRYQYDEQKITIFQPWRGYRNFGWEEIADYTSSDSLQIYKLITKNGRSFRLSHLLDDIEVFMNRVDEYIQRSSNL